MEMYVLAGGPHTGKTTLLRHLRTKGYVCKDEIARGIIGREQDAAAQDPTHLPLLPWTDFPGFQRRVLTDMIERDRSCTAPRTFLDYGLGDTLAYFYEGKVPIPFDVLDTAKGIGYSAVFFLAPVPHYRSDLQRWTDEVMAERIHRRSYEIYHELGFDIIDVPLMSVEERAAFVLAVAGKHF